MQALLVTTDRAFFTDLEALWAARGLGSLTLVSTVEDFQQAWINPPSQLVLLDTRSEASPGNLLTQVLPQVLEWPDQLVRFLSIGDRFYPRSGLEALSLIVARHWDWSPQAREFPAWFPTSADHANAASWPSRRVPRLFGVQGEAISLRTYEPSFQPTLQQLMRIAAHNVTLLIIGETGTGKTTLAQLLHQSSPRRDHPFMHLACGALPKDLIESELFGHARGAFTGADRHKIGRFEAAGAGTLLLDEIDTLGPNEQAKLLKVIESGEYELVGSTETKVSQARLIVASNICLESMTQANKFRSDLYYRLNVLEFRLPPLRERPLDLIPLALQFIDESSREYGIPIHKIHHDFLEAIRCYPWPGNLRELKNHLRRAVLFCNDACLTINDLAPAVLKVQFQPTQETEVREQEPEAWRLADRVATSEREMLEQALRANSFRRTATARALGISRVGLYKKMKKHGILDLKVDD